MMTDKIWFMSLHVLDGDQKILYLRKFGLENSFLEGN